MSNQITTFQLTPDAWLYQADCRDVLRALPENSIDSVVTDPPYHLTSVVKRFGGANAAPAKHGTDGLYARQSRGFMQKQWDGGDIAFDPETWALVLRVLKPGAHLVAFGAPRGYHRMACAIEDAGFEIRDSLMWIFGVGFPKSHNVALSIDKESGAIGHLAKSFNMKGGGDRSGEFFENGRDFSIKHVPATPAAREWEGWGTALKPAFEPIILARKPLENGLTVAANVLRWRTGALNIDACRVGSESTRRPVGKPLNGGAYGSDRSERETLERVGGSDAGRWPANLAHDGSVEVIEAFPQSQVSGSAKTGRPAKAERGQDGSINFGMKRQGTLHNDEGSAARFFFNTSESDTQWLARNLPSDLAHNADNFSSLDGSLAVSVLKSAVAHSMLRSVLMRVDSPEHFTNVTLKELKRISDVAIEMILNLGEKCTPESLPLKHTRSDNLANIAAIRTQIDTITITISRSKLNGCVAPATFSITLPNSERGEKDSASRLHYSAKANKTDRAGSKHPTIKPVSLMKWLTNLVTPKGGVILDPFAGSGTTGQAALENGFRCVLVEREAEYVADIIRRIGSLPKKSDVAA